ncbi:MAG: hypothetical protein ACFFEJ_07935 [Candidatus Thorarchaeota archaeon]
MVRRFVEPSRLKKAEKISDSKVNLHILREQPLSLWATLAGSGSSPYLIAIDLEMGVVGHVCPDFVRASSRITGGSNIGWCKHMGKILLMLSSSQVEEIYQAIGSLRVVKSTKGLPEIIEEIKKQAAAPKKDTEVSLRDRIVHAAKSEKPSEAELDLIRNRLREEVGSGSVLHRLMHMQSILNDSARFIDVVTPLLVPHYKIAETDFFHRFWTKGGIQRLDETYILNAVAKRLGVKLTYDLLVVPDDISIEEKADGKFTLDLIGLSHPELEKILADVEERRLDRFRILLGISGTRFQEVESYVETKTKSRHEVQSSFSSRDDFLIYFLQAAQYDSPFDIERHKLQNHYRIPRELETDDVLTYVMKSISTTGVLQLTQDEVNQHQRLLTWMKNPTGDRKWVERPRLRTADRLLKTDGFIVQWEVNATRTHKEFFQAYDGTDRLIIDRTTPLYADIQPYDLTLCQVLEQRGSKLERIVRPSNILMPDQAVRLVLSGTDIISNILPWDVLHEFAHTGVVKAGETLAAIKACRTFPFVFGSQSLEKALMVIRNLGATGMSQKKYQELHTSLRTGSDRLTPDIRPFVHEIIVNEGPEFEIVSSLIDKEEDLMRLILKIGRSTSSLVQFRLKICEYLVNLVFTKMLPEGSLKKVAEGELGHYDMFKGLMRQHVKELSQKSKKTLQEDITLKQIRDDPLLKVLATEVKAPMTEAVSDIAKSELVKLVSRVQKLV